jgi:hypothetical protein
MDIRRLFLGVVFVCMVAFVRTAPAWAQAPLALEPLESPADSITPQPFIEGCMNIGQWPTVAGRTRYYGQADWAIDLLSDAEQQACFASMNAAGIKLSFGVGVLKPQCQTAQTCFNDELPKWLRAQNNGGQIGAFFLDEPLTAVRAGWVSGDLNYAADQTRWYVGQLRQQFPGAAVIEIEAYPFIPASVLIDWISAISSSNRPDYFETDYDLNAYSADPRTDMLDLAFWSHQNGLSYALLMAYAGNGFDDYVDWYQHQLVQNTYYDSGPGGIDILHADLYHISAFFHTPRTTANENQPYSFMYTVKQFLGYYTY